MLCSNCGKTIIESENFCGNCGTKVDETIISNKTESINKNIIKISLRKLILISLFVMILICIVILGTLKLLNRENIVNNNTTSSNNNTNNSNISNTFSNMNEDDKIEYAVTLMQEYELLLNFYAKAHGYTTKPYENMKINSIALTEYQNNKYVLADFTIIAKEKETVFQYGIQGPSMTDFDIQLFFEDATYFKQQKYSNYINIKEANRNSIIELDVNRVQEKFSNEHLPINLVMEKVLNYKKIITNVDFDHLNENEYIFLGVQPIATPNMSYYYANFKKTTDYIYQLPISASSVSRGLIPNGIYKLHKNGTDYICEYDRYSKKSHILDNLKDIDENNVYVFSNTDVSNSIIISFAQENTHRGATNICSQYGELIGDIIYDDENKNWKCKIKVETTKKEYVLKELSKLDYVNNIKVEY